MSLRSPLGLNRRRRRRLGRRPHPSGAFIDAKGLLIRCRTPLLTGREDEPPLVLPTIVHLPGVVSPSTALFSPVSPPSAIATPTATAAANRPAFNSRLVTAYRLAAVVPTRASLARFSHNLTLVAPATPPPATITVAMAITAAATYRHLAVH